jgi:cobalt-zinc-cadmium efflux system membrane fusion protein
VDAISVRPGDSVGRGGLLGTVQSPELGAAIAAYRSSRARDDAADARLERLQRLESQGVSSRSQVLEAEAAHSEAEGDLEAAEERLRILGVDPSVGDPHGGEHYVSHVPLRSPIGGKVLRVDAAVGRNVAPGETLFHVGDLSQVWLLVDVYERDLGQVREGQPVSFTVAAWPETTFQGAVEHVGDWVDPDGRTIEVRVGVDNSDGRLKPNMFATATLAVGAPEAASGVVLPAAAVTELDGRTVTFIQTDVGRFEARPVDVAERSATEVLVAAGVEPGATVVIDGAFALKSELEKSELGEGHAH